MAALTTFLDFLGQKTSVGDTVITTELAYRNFIHAKVIRITPKMVFVEELKPKQGCSKTYSWKAEQHFVIRVENPLTTDEKVVK